MSCLIEVQGENYAVCENYAKTCWAKTGKSVRNGNNAYDRGYHESAELIGALGEMAFSIFSELPVDFEYNQFGKKVDFTNDKGETIDFKTSDGYRNYGGLITQIEHGREHPLWCDYYFFGALVAHKRESRYAKIDLLGFTSRRFLTRNKKRYTKPGIRRPQDFNYQIPYEDFFPIECTRRYKLLNSLCS